MLYSEVVRRQKGDRERGAGVVEYLGLSAMAIGVIFGLQQGMQALGVDIMNEIRNLIGI